MSYLSRGLALAMLLAVIPCQAEEVKLDRKITAIVYSQPGCAPCLKMKKAFVGTKLPVTFEERPEELRNNRIKSTPTTIIFTSGWPVLRVSGMLTPQALKEIIARYEK